MSVYRPKEWIATVLGKFDKLLELSVTQNISLSSQLESHKDCLINISESKCPTIISGLTTSLKKLSNIRIYGDRQEYKLYSSQIVVLNLLEKCITAKDSALPEDSILMKQLLSEICQFLHQPTNDKALVEQLKASASRVLYCISQNNFNIVFSRIANRLHDLYLNSDDFTELNDLDLIRHVHINITKLTKLLDEIILKFKSLKKSVQLSVLANLDAALWGWVCTYPDELNLLYQPVQTGFDQGQQATDRGEIQLQIQQEERLARNRRLSVAAEQLFDLVDGSGEVSKKKAASLWPLQTLLLLLCPDVVKQVASRKQQQQQQQPKSSKIELLATVKRHLSSSVTRQLQEYSVDSLVRVAKVACCVAPSCGEDQLPLHRLVDSFLLEFQTFLFDGGSKYFNKTSDEESLIECFVCSFRLAPDLLSLPRLCASSSSSIHHKVVLVQALCCLSTQPPLSWWPKVDRLYSYGSDIRKIFRDCVAKTQTQVHASPRNTQSIRVRMERMNVGLKRSQDESPNHRDLLRVILQLIQSNPSLLLHNLGSTSQQIHSEMFDFSNHLVLLFSIHPQTNLQLAVESSGALLRLHDPLNIALWNPESTMATFWEVSSHVVSSVCDKLLASQMMTSPELTLHAIKWLQQVLARRIEFVMQNHTRQGTNNTSDAVRKTKLKLEQTLLEHLWHQSEEVVSVALTCFQGLYEETELRWTFDDCLGGRLYTERYECYQELSSAALLDDGDVIHKRVKSVLRKMNRFPQASLQAWEDTLNKWEAKTHSLSHKQSKDDYAVVTSAGESPNSGKSTKKALATEQEVHDWTNLSGFLCSLGGVCAKSVEVVSSSLTSLAWDRRTSSSSVLSSSAGPSSPSDHHGNARQGPGSSSVSSGHASRFVGHLINMLSKANSRIPDVSAIVRNLLAYDLHPALFPTLFQQITFVLKTNLFDSEGRIVQNHFTDQLVHGVIYILQIIFQESSEQDGDYLGEESIEDTILYIVRYIRQMGARMSAFALRILFCKMVTELMIRKSDFFFLSEIKFRNKLVEHLADWLMTLSNQNTNSNHVLLRELDESAVVAIGALLDGLPLHPDEGDGGDVPKAKSQLFLKYFTLFMRLLSTDDCQGNNDVINGDDVTALRSSVILAMSNLLSANIEYGLVHAMGLAYHPDIQTRAAFLEVLIKILQQGTAGFDTLGDSVSAERFERLVELVTMMGDNGELPIANALANVVHTTYMDELARVFVTLFDAKHLLYQLLWNMFTKEVEEAPNGQTLFRGNSLASKIMKFCFKVYGASYLHNLVEPLIEWSLGPEIVALQFEVDQKRIQPGAGVDILQCRANLQRLTERFFTRIMTSTDKFPPQLKSVCHCLYQVVSQRFHESGTGAVASAIFLRFLNPAIATPYEMGLSDKPIPPNLAKAFKLVCKLMQKIANHVVFTKEEHMKHFNEFVKARFDVCQQFFMQISTPECASLEGVVHSNPIVNGSNVQALHRLLWNDQEKIGQFLANSRNAKAVGRRPFDKMVTLLAYLGPPEYTRPVLETRTTGQTITPCKFEELMTKRKVAESDQFKMVKGLNIFYQFGRSKMGYPVFYYIAKRYIQSEIREDILMFYILQALKPYSSRKFDVIIDLTHVEANNGFRQQYLPKWLVVYTPQIYKNLNAVYVYNPNTWVMAYVNRNQAFFDKVKHSNIIFLDHLSDLQEHIDPDHQKIPSATKSLDEDIAVFRNVYRSGPTKVDLKIGSRAVQFTSVEKHKLLNRDVVLNDIFYASEIESIQSVDDSHTFGLKVACDNAVIIFSHPEALRIAQGLRHLRARWELTQPELSTPHHKIGAKDVPGTLLNMALLNLGCPDPVVRSSAYNLLCVLTSCFHLQLEGRLCGSEGLCIPANNTLFIVSISTTLAKNESHLTLEFLDECITGYRCLSDTLKNLCLEYMEPWLFNLPAFVSPSEYKRNKVKSVIHKLIELTIAERDFYPSVQIKVWGNLGMLSPLTDLILEAFVETSSEGGLSSLKAEVMADTSVSLAVSNIKVVSGKLINLLCTIVDKTSLRPTPTLQKHKHWEEIAILARFLLMLSFNNNLDVITQLPNLFHLVTLLLSTGPISLRASVHGLVVNIIHSLLTCNRPEFKERTRQVLRLSLTEFCLPKFYLYFGISDVKSAADTALKAEFGQICEATSLMPERHLVTNGNGCRDEDNVINLCYLNEVTDRLLEVMEACVKDVPDCDWLSEWRELSEKFAFQYNPSLQPRAIVVLGCINKQPSLRHIKKVISIMGKSLESQADPVLLESTLLALTRLQLVTRASLEVKSSLFWVAICALQMNAEHLYAAGLALLEQNLHHLDELELFATQSFAVALMKSRMPMERYFRPLEVAVGLSFQFSFHFAFVTHLIKGFRHSDPVTVARLIRLLDFCLELVSRNRACHKYEVNPDSSPYIAALLPVCEEARRHCVPRRKVESINGHSTTSSKVSSGRCATAPPSVHSAVDEPGNCSDSPSSGGHSSVKSCHNSAAVVIISESGVATTSGRNLLTIGEAQHRNKGRDGVRSKRPESRESGTTPTKMRKVGETSHDSDSSSGATSHVTSSSKRSSQRKHSIVSTCNALFGDDILDQSTQALLLTLLATLVKHSPNNSDVQVLFEYLAEASHIFPDVFPIVHSMMDHKINSILNQCEDAAILGHVQTIVHNAASHQSDEGVHRQFTILQEIGFGGMWRFAGPFAQVASLEHASDVVNLIDSIVLHHMGDVPDLTPVASRQSLNSALSAASADDLPESEEFELSDLDDDDDEDEDDKEEVNDNDDVMDARPSAEVAKTAKPGSFRNKGPKLTIKLPG